jgi:hypothetical protein
MILSYFRDYFYYSSPPHFKLILSTLTFTFGLAPKYYATFVWAGWTLGVEMLFYIMFPLFASVSKNILATCFLFIGSLFLSHYVSTVLFVEFGDYAHLNILSELPYFLFGILLYSLYEHGFLTCIPQKWNILLGLFFIISFFISNDTVTQFFLFFTFFIFLLASTLITDFTNVLIDIRDNAIILPKPINDKTFLLARLFHIIIHVSKLVLPMTLPSLITVGIKYGSWGVVTLILLIPPVTLFTIFLINALYILILKVSTPEKFKNIISYFQIVFAIVNLIYA